MIHCEDPVLNEVYKQVFDAVPLGLFFIGPDHRIYAWNKWMAQNTEFLPEQAIGQTLESLYPALSNFRFEWALEQVLYYKNPQVLSSILNGFVIPIPLTRNIYLDTTMMQQNIEILPMTQGNKNMALVVIQDVSDKTNLKNTLLMLASRFEQHSLIDPLTGCYNRRFLWQHLEDELKDAERKGHHIVCCIFDLDHFKAINDEFGHDAGDEVILSFVKTCRSNLRANDKFFRYGGEEFIAVFRDISLKNVINSTNRVRKAFESISTHGSVNKRMTCSGGIAYWNPSQPFKTAAQLVKEADIALYKAKESGRNRIIYTEL
jgi:diguanylate cyclase (GGDEF)-like protein